MATLKQHSLSVALFYLALLAFGAILLPSCQEKIIAPERAQSLEVQIRPHFRSAVLASSISKYTVTVSGEGMKEITVDLKLIDGKVVGRVDEIPVGPARLFVLEGLDVSGVALYRGESTVDILPGVVASIDVTLVPVAPLLRLTPSLDSLLVPGNLGDTVSLKLSIHNAPNINTLNLQILFPKNLVVASVGPSPLLPQGSFVGLLDSIGGIAGSILNPNGVLVDSLGNAELAILKFTRVSRSAVYDSVVVSPVISGFLGNNTIPQIYTDDALIRLPGFTLVFPQNRAPILGSISDTTVTVGNKLRVSVSATDPDGTTPSLSASILRNSTFIPNGDGTAIFEFIPDSTQIGTHEVFFVASDTSLSDTASMSITVLGTNRPPVLAPIGGRNVPQGVTLTFTIFASDPDLNTPALFVTGLPSGAVFSDDSNGRGTFTWTPGIAQVGSHAVTFFASDGILVDSEIVVIVVTENGDPGIRDTISVGDLRVGPGASFALGVRIFNDEILTGGEVDLSWGDPDLVLDSVDFRASVLRFVPEIATLVTIDTLGLGAVAITFIKSGQPQIQPSSGFFATLWFSVSPTSSNKDVIISANQNGVDDDIVFLGANNVLFAPLFLPGTVTIVASGNLFPVLEPIGAKSITEGSLLSFTVRAIDPNGTIPTFRASGLPPFAVFTDNFDGTATFSWTPNSTQSGVYNVTFFAADARGSSSEVVTITVNNLGNSLPTIQPVEPKFVTVLDTLIFIVQSSDPETVPIVSLTKTNLPQSVFFQDNGGGGGMFVWVPTANDIGVYFATFEADDKDGGIVSLSTTITVRDPCGLSLIADFDTDIVDSPPNPDILRLNYNAQLAVTAPAGDLVLIRDAFGTQPVELKDSVTFRQGDPKPSLSLIPDTTMDCNTQVLVWAVTVLDTLDKASRIDIRGEGGILIGSITYKSGGTLVYNDSRNAIPVSYAPGPNIDDQLLYIAELDFVKQVVRLRIIRSDGSSAAEAHPFLNRANRFHALQFSAIANGFGQATSIFIDDVIIAGQ